MSLSRRDAPTSPGCLRRGSASAPQILFYDEDVADAERLNDAGVPCHLEVVEGAFHGFDRIGTRARVSRAYFESQCEALRSALTP